MVVFWCLKDTHFCWC